MTPTMTTTTTSTPKKEETNVVETVQSIILAFGIAMAARSFVTEGFFIPTGSMAPTLMGQHARLTGPFTGYEYPVDAQLYESVRGMLGANWRQEIEGMQNLRLAGRKVPHTDREAIPAWLRARIARDHPGFLDVATQWLREGAAAGGAP